MSDGDVREAARAEVCGYWAWAFRRPWRWLDPLTVDLGLTGMARARHAVRTGRLLTKTAAIDHRQGHAPLRCWLRGTSDSDRKDPEECAWP